MNPANRDGTTTLFLPAQRTSQQDIKRQHELVMGLPMVASFLDATVGLVAILNDHRQVIYLNDAFRKFLNRSDPRFGLGLRIGELFRCAHAGDAPNGCGTAEACTVCGGAQAQCEVLQGKAARSVKECLIETSAIGQDYNLTASVTKLRALGLDLMVFAALDISNERRRQALERIFFHDVMNTAGGIQGLAGAMAESPPEQVITQYVPLIGIAAVTLMEEITSQRDLLSAERGEIQVKPSLINARKLMTDLGSIFASHSVAEGKKIVCDAGDELTLVSDPRLLYRVLGNIVKNALEAEGPGAVITLSCQRRGPNIGFIVRNPTPIPREIQLQIFQKSFSTKGVGRGLGTYSIRLLTERYLKGRVEFLSESDGGTWFLAEFPPSIT